MQAIRPTLSDVAARAGVSKATASRVLGNTRDRVSEALVERVIAAADELGYVPNPHARALARAQSPTVALIVQDVADPFFSEIARGALRVAADHERLVMICTTFRDPEVEAAYFAEIRSQRITRVLMAGTAAHAGLHDELAAYQAEGGRVVLMIADLGYPAVVPDDREGGRQAAQHLVDLGHRRLGVVAGPRGVGSVTKRLEGITEAILEARLDAPPVVYGDFTREGGERMAAALFDTDPSVTAVLALNDMMAVGVMRYLADAGKKVPEDVSVIGFDDIPLAGDLSPGLTTIRVPMEAIGRASMDLVLEDEIHDTATTRVLQTELVVRQTTAARTQ